MDDEALSGVEVDQVFTGRHDRRKVTDWVCEEIRDAIIDLRLRPGEPLREATIATQLGVSKTPIREALRRLAALGLVSFVPNRGVRVRTISQEELHEAFMVRAELEALALSFYWHTRRFLERA